MKIIKRYTHFYYIIFTGLLLISVTCYLKKILFLTQLASISWLALGIAFFIIVSPWGSKKLISNPQKIKNKKPKQRKPIERKILTFQAWFLRILALEISLVLIYLGICRFNTSTSPIEPYTHSPVFADSLHHLLLHAGLYPWAIIAVLAVSLGFITFHQGQDTYFCDLARGLTRKPIAALDAAINAAGRTLTFSALGISAMFSTLLLLNLLLPNDTLMQITGFKLGSIGAAFIMLFLTLRRKENHFLSSLQNLRPGLGMLLNVIIWTVILAVFALVTQNYAHSKPVAIPSALSAVMHKDWSIPWQIMAYTWWLLFTPITAVFIAHYSYGYSLRAVILGVLCFPCLLALIFLLSPLIHWQLYQHLPKSAASVCALIGFVVLFGILLNKKNFALTSQTYLSFAEQPKQRSIELFNQRWKKMSGIFFYFFIPAGIFVLSILFLSIFIGGIFVLLLIILSFAVTLWQSTLEKNCS